MRIVKWVPKACQGEEANFSGHLMIQSLRYEERMSMLEDSGIQLVNGEVNQDDLKNIVAMGKLAMKMKPNVKEVHLVYKPEDLKIESFEDLEYEPAASKIMQELAALALNGVRPSKE